MTDETPPGDGELHGGHRYEAAVMMKFPFLALAEGRTKDIIFPDKSGKILHEVTTHRTKGMAFVSDLNILIWVISELHDRIRVRQEPRDDIVLSITRSELLRYIGKDPGGAQHEDIAEAIDRLHATRVKTNLPYTVTGHKVCAFSLLEKCVRDDTDPTNPTWMITPPDWLIDVVARNLVVRINPESMKLHGIARCVYRYARATVGDALFKIVPLDSSRAIDRFGSTAPVSTMKHKLKKLIKDIETTKALRVGKITLNAVGPLGSEKSKADRRVMIPDYLVTPSATGGITLTLDPEASTLGTSMQHHFNLGPYGLFEDM